MLVPRSLSGGLLAAVLTFSLSVAAHAQCGLQWQLGGGASGPLGNVYATARLANGNLVAGGFFGLADGAAANNVAVWDGTSWTALGSGLDAAVLAIATMPNGDIVVGGGFSQAGGVAANHIARWNGSIWSPLGPGLSASVQALQALPGGELIAAGPFQNAGGTQVNGIARWDGSTWSPVGPGIFTGFIQCLARLPNGDLLAGGAFESISLNPVEDLARWDGVTWSAVPGLDEFSTVTDIQPLTLGRFAIAGDLVMGGVHYRVALFDGVVLQPLTPPPGLFEELGVTANGDLIAGGYLSGAQNGTVAMFDGTTWTSLSNNVPVRVRSLSLDASNNLLAAGIRSDTSVSAGGGVARLLGNTWSSLGAALPPRINAMVTMPDGDLVVGGQFASIGGVVAANVARWNGSTWLPLALGVGGGVTAMSVNKAGSLIVSGDFLDAGGGPANHIARWNGIAWSSLAGGLAAAAKVVAANDQGQVLASGSGGVLLFDGLVWSPPTPLSVTLNAAVAEANGDFLLGGLFLVPNLVSVVRYSGGVITPEVSGMTFVRAMIRESDTSVVAVGTGITGIARRQGGVWSPVGNGTSPFGQFSSVALLPNGNLVSATSDLNLATVARFDGTTWQSLGVLAKPGVAASIRAMTADRQGELFVAGEFTQVDNLRSVGLARSVPTCPADAIVLGAGCSGGAGPVTLVADNLPWLGATFRSTASGFTASSLGLQLVGTTPLSVPLPLGAPGCSLLVDPIFFDLLLPAGGKADALLSVPSNPALVGQSLRTQVVGLELGAGSSLVRVTSSNALRLTVGSF